ncbi:hypothetical protein JGI7_01093 [Candidatus Kryptonium thompsonii]|nr:hypothetical protein [Candidatus Kryptonium thompsoni]CUS87318.1 hypothetical protein JGI7_01093 [Candidatus Kryptonium thompsoni]CUS89117.1 hypothetical protein JGI13_01662 [Candidatus Kryptonium thompsoni]
MLLALFNFSYAHKQNVHQYICIEAYNLEMKDHIGGMDVYYIGDGLWRTGFTTGAWREGRGGEEIFKRYRLYVGIGAPYVFNLGFRYRLSKSWFVEAEIPVIPVGLAFNFGTSTTEYVNPPRFVFYDLEVKVVIGYDLLSFAKFASFGLFYPPRGIGIGLVAGFDVETKLGFLLYMKLGGIYQSGYAGIYYIQMGMGWNF